MSSKIRMRVPIFGVSALLAFSGLVVASTALAAPVLVGAGKAGLMASAAAPASRTPFPEAPPVRGPKPVEFDAPHAATQTSSVCGQFCGTIALTNNDLGVTVGYFTDKYVVPHGFFREPNGKIHEFDAPGAGLGHFLNQGTVPYAINNLNVIAGEFEDSLQIYHAFILDAGGFKVYDAPGAGSGPNQGTFAFNINNSGATSGIYADSNGVYHGYVSTPSGAITGFDPTGSVYTWVCEETCQNDSGAIVGYFVDGANVVHGFLRSPDGSITQIDAPDAAQASGSGTFAASINAGGEIGGYYVDANGVVHGFIRHAGGRYSEFNAPRNNQVGTYPFSINFFGATTGATGALLGFERLPDGETETFIAPDAAHQAGFDGTRPSTLNMSGEVAGWYIDVSGLDHGFVWKP